MRVSVRERQEDSQKPNSISDNVLDKHDKDSGENLIHD